MCCGKAAQSSLAPGLDTLDQTVIQAPHSGADFRLDCQSHNHHSFEGAF